MASEPTRPDIEAIRARAEQVESTFGPDHMDPKHRELMAVLDHVAALEEIARAVAGEAIGTIPDIQNGRHSYRCMICGSEASTNIPHDEAWQLAPMLIPHAEECPVGRIQKLLGE